MNYTSIVEELRTPHSALNTGSQAFRNVFDKLMQFDKKLQKMPDEDKFQCFASDDMDEIISDCDKYIRSHFPFTAKSREQLNRMQELRSVLEDMRQAGHSVIEYDRYVRENISEPLEQIRRYMEEQKYDDARSSLRSARECAENDLSSKTRDLNIVLSRCHPSWGGKDIGIRLISGRISRQQEYLLSIDRHFKNIAGPEYGSAVPDRQKADKTRITFKDLEGSSGTALSHRAEAGRRHAGDDLRIHPKEKRH